MLSKIKCLMLSVCLAAFSVFGADENLLKNATGAELSPFKLPLNWEVRTTQADGFTTADGVMTLDAEQGGSDVYLIQRNLPLDSQNEYTLVYSVKGEGEYRAYVEYILGNGTKAHGASWQKAPAQWTERTLTIKTAPESKHAKLVFHTRNKGKVELRAISITAKDANSVQAAGIGQNLSFGELKNDGTPQFWSVRGGDGAVTFAEGTATLRKTTDAAPFLIQVPLALPSKQNHRFSAEIKGDKGAKYRFYLEEVQANNQRKAFGRVTPQEVPQEWTPVYFDAVVAADNSRKQLVINNPANTGSVSFRKLSIVAVDASAPAVAANVLTMLGVPVKLNGDSKITAVENGTPAVNVAYVSNYVAGAVAPGVKVEPGKYYELQYMVKGEGLTSKGTTGIMHFFDVRVDLKDGSELLRSSWDDVMSHASVPKTFVFKVPENHKGLIDIGMGVTDGSHVAFQLTALKEKIIDPAETMRLIVISPAYRNGIYETLPVAEVAGFAETGPAGKKIIFTVSRGNEKLAESTVDAVDGQAGFKFAPAIFKTGASEIECRIFDADGKELKKLVQTITRYPRAKGNEVIIGQDKQFYVNGKLFLPIVQYGMRPDNLRHVPQTDVDTVRYVSRGGSNVFIFSPKTEADALRILDICVANKSMALLSIGFWRGPATQENAERWGHGVCSLLTPQVLAHPGFFGFYFADEPRWNGVPAINLQLSSEVLKKITPYHPTHIVAAPRGSVEDHLPYAATADFYGIDIYPVPEGSHSNLDDRTVTSVGKYTRRAAGMVENRKPVMMTLQAFAWGELSKRTRIYPTVAESRFMAYDAFLNGATCVAYYALRHVVTPSFIDDINTVTLELHRMSRLLTMGKVIADQTENDIHYRALEYDGKRYVIALNTKKELRRTAIKAGFKADKVNVLEENREIAVKNGEIDEEFPPFGVRVYAEAPLPSPLSELPEGKAENPWLDFVKQLTEVNFYNGKANWIWDKNLAGKAMSEVYLSKGFELKKDVKSITMRTSADNMADVWLNEKPAGKVDDWEYMTTLDLTALAKQGSNRLSVFAADGLAPPCAFLADIDIEYQDGSREKIMTDASWKCSPVKVDNWMNTEVVEKHFKAVDFIVPYGSGRWANRVKTK